MTSAIHFSFSTDGIAPRRRLDVWRETLFQAEFNVDIEPILPEHFRAQATVRTLPGLRLLSGTSSPATYQRATKRVVHDEVALSFGNQTQASTRLKGREALIEDGVAGAARFSGGLGRHGDFAKIR